MKRASIVIADASTVILSQRQADVIRAAAMGLGVKATAAKLKIGAESVKSHRESACRKLGVVGVTAAAVVLTKAGLV